MLAPALALFALLLVPSELAEAGDAALVARLGSTRYADREAAEAALIGRGPAALPTLRASADHRDLEVRTRVATILRQVEQAALFGPTMVTLDDRDVPLGRAIDRINARAGLSVAVASPLDAPWVARRVSIESAAPVPFWSAIDRICEAGGLGQDLALALADPRPGRFLLHDGPGSPAGLISDSGPFRVQLASVAYQSELFLSRPGSSGVIPAPSRQMYLQLLVAAEPRLAITQDGPAVLREAIDDRAQSLIPASPTIVLSHSSGYFGMNATPLVRLRVDLARPDEAGKRIVRLRGAVPVAVSARKPLPLIVPLDAPAGRVHRNGDTELVVHEVRAARGDQPSAIELSIIAPGDPSATPADDQVKADPAKAGNLPQQLEILDARGEILPWFPATTAYAGNETRSTLILSSQSPTGVPATIRYHGIIRGTTEVAFEFRDIPMP